MPSIIKGYEYDIFISYRQNDNKYDNWVTVFADDLNIDLEATIKERITIYPDEIQMMASIGLHRCLIITYKSFNNS